MPKTETSKVEGCVTWHEATFLNYVYIYIYTKKLHSSIWGYLYHLLWFLQALST